MNKSTNISKISILILVVIGLNFISNYLYKRFDLTQDKRYTLSQPAKKIISSIDDYIMIKVYLEGDFPSEFKRLQDETKQILEEIKVENS